MISKKSQPFKSASGIFRIAAVLLMAGFFLAKAAASAAQTSDSDSGQPDNAEAVQYFERGKTLHLAQKYTDAIKEYEKAIALSPDFSKARQALAWAKRDLRRKQMSQPNSYTLDHVVQEAEEDFKRGQAHERNSRFMEAAAAYKEALRLIPNYPEAREALRRVQTQAQRTLVPMAYSGAVNVSATAKTYDPLERTISNKEFQKKAFTQDSEYRPEQKAEYNRQIKDQIAMKKSGMNTAPNNGKQPYIREAIQKHYLAGTQALDHGDYATAVKEFELILEFDPDHREAQYKLNLARKHQTVEVKTAKRKVELAKTRGDTAAQLTALRDVLNIDPNDQEAVEEWEKTKTENKEIVDQIYRKGVSAYAKGEYDVALQAWELVLDLDPNHNKAQESINKVRQKLEFIK